MKAKQYRPVAFELMQYFYAQAHEPLIHACIRYSSRLDERLLAEAVSVSIASVPLLGCVFSPHPLRPRWLDRGFNGQDIVCVRITSDPVAAEAIQTAMTGSISVESEPQMRITLVRTDTQDTLCLLVNHMVCDGAGLKQYLALLSRLYAALLAGRSIPKLTPTIRSANHLFSALRLRQLLRVLTHSYPKLAQAKSFRVPLAEDGNPPHIVSLPMPVRSLNAIRQYARAQGATVNDVLLAAYARILARQTGERQISLPCPVDLRKYLMDKDTPSICNLTVNYVVSLQIDPETPFLSTLMDISRQITKQKQSDDCLKSVLLVGLGMRAVPFFLLNKIFPRVFTIPVISYTNLGVLDEQSLLFGEAHAADAFLTGAIKRAPYFQLAVSTFGGAMTLSCDLYGSEQAVRKVDSFLSAVADEIMLETA